MSFGLLQQGVYSFFLPGELWASVFLKSKQGGASQGMAKGKNVSIDLRNAAGQLIQKDGRHFLAIAGAPGSGKSSTAKDLWQWLEKTQPGRSAILPMDGFHFDDAVLHERGRHPWKGAPDTFDVGGLRSTLKRLRDPGEAAVAVPVFDRELEISRGSARIIQPEAKLIIVEGNYLLLDQAPWSELADCFDFSVMIDVPEAELRHRLHRRWVHFGLDEETITHKLDENDLPNGRMIINNSRKADLVIRQR